MPFGHARADERKRHRVEPPFEHRVDVEHELARNAVLIGGDAEIERAHRPLDGRPVQRGEARADSERAAPEIGAGRRKNRRVGIVLLHGVLQIEAGSPMSRETRRRHPPSGTPSSSALLPVPVSRGSSFHAQSHVASSSSRIQRPAAVSKRVFGRFCHRGVLQLRVQRRPVETEIRADAGVVRDADVVVEQKAVDGTHQSGHGVEPAVDDELFARDERAGLVAGEQQRCADELARLAESVHRRVRHDFGDALGLKNLPVLLGGKEARHQHVDAHAMRRPLARKVERQVVHGALGRRIREHARQRHDARHRPDVDDRSALAGLDEVFAEHLTPEEHALQVDADDAIELVFGDVEKRGRRVDAGAVDDDVDAAGALQDGAEQRFDFGFAGRFCGVKPRAAAGRLDLRRASPWPSPRLRPTMTTSAPAPASPSAIAPHSSPVPPMTTATLSCREKSEVRKSADFECGTRAVFYIHSPAGITRTESPNSCGRYPCAAISSSAADQRHVVGKRAEQLVVARAAFVDAGKDGVDHAQTRARPDAFGRDLSVQRGRCRRASPNARARGRRSSRSR